MMQLGQKGFTIIEVLVSLVIGSIVILLIFGITFGLYGDQLRESARADMTLESQLFLREMVEDIRVAGEIRATNQITDPNRSAGWVTSDPANILIVTFPATDANGSLVVDNQSGFPYQNEIIYFGVPGTKTMYKRVLANPDALLNGSINKTTCPEEAATSGCPEDARLSENLGNLLFEFYDIDDEITTDIPEAYAVQLTVNLNQRVNGVSIDLSNSIKATMRNKQ